MNIVLSALCMASGMALIFASLAFINAQLLPSLLGGVYAIVPSAFMRTVIGAVSIVLVANYLIAKGYMYGGQAYGGPLYVLCVISGMITMAMLVDNLSFNWHIFGGGLLLSAGALWVVYGLSQG